MTLTLTTAIIGVVAMILGEWWRTEAPGAARDAPIAQATGIALAMATCWPGELGTESGEHRCTLWGLLGPLALALGATLVVGLARRGRGNLVADVGRCLASVLTAGLLARVPGPAGNTLLERVGHPQANAGLISVLLLIVAVLAVWVPLVARALRAAAYDPASFGHRLFTDVQRSGVLPLATATTAAVMAIALPVLGPATLILFLVPMAVLLPAVTSQRSVRAAQQQTIVALAGLTDQAGFTSAGHAVRVAALAVPVARDAGVEDEDLADVETVALLHDVGQVGLDRPIPGGATTEISMRDQRRVAATGAAILARTAQLSRIAPLVADVGVPHHRARERGDVSAVSRVVRVVSAYDDLAGHGTRLGGAGGPVAALERLVRSAPREFDPDIVRALLRQLERRGDLTLSEGDRLRSLLVPTVAGAGTAPKAPAPTPAHPGTQVQLRSGRLPPA
ncbi:HD-GYP domain-containing protein [Ornithinimicrobium panacihumi]|uniref:HD-GYP domain-containing protein n=1 Tax=Ornithinimicrobium panacihumi TaxID=2008449 RepID=UPI003F88CAF1